MRLKSKVGPTSITIRKMVKHDRGVEYSKLPVRFSIDNSCIADVPPDWWEEVRDEYFDRSRSWKYRDVFIPL